MMIFWDARVALLAVPKTGTQALEASLAGRADVVLRHPPKLKHMTAQRFVRRFRPLLPPAPGRPLSVVAVMRDPLDWLASWYRYRRRDALAGHENSTAGIGFDAFVQAHIGKRAPGFAAVGSQFSFLTDDRGQVLPDHIFDYADQPSLLAFLSRQLGDIIAPPHRRNISPPAETELSDATLGALRNVRASDFALYDEVRAGRYLPG